MPGRMFTALTVPGGSVSGTTQVNGFTVPVDLALTSRTGNEPTQYVASRSIDLDEGFESGLNDDVTAYIADTSYAGGGNGGSGADGVAGAGKYAYSFNGKRKDNEIQGESNTYEYGAREYDPRGPRFWSIDPLTKQYPELTPYQFASNRPIDGSDLDGKEWELSTPANNLKAIPQMRYDAIIKQAGTIKTWDGQPNFWGKLQNNIEKIKSIPGGTSGYMGLKVLYGVIDDAHVTYTGWKDGPGYARHLDNSSAAPYKERIASGINTVTLVFGGVQAVGEYGLIKGLSIVESNVVNEANKIYNSKEFETIKHAYETGTEASVKVGDRIINYSPETAGSSITMHESPFHEGSGFQLGPQAFETTLELKKTFIQELYRLNTQSTGELGVDVTRGYTDEAFEAAEKLNKYVIKK
jgi:RHS repeat-associated protein